MLLSQDVSLLGKPQDGATRPSDTTSCFRAGTLQALSPQVTVYKGGLGCVAGYLFSTKINQTLCLKTPDVTPDA